MCRPTSKQATIITIYPQQYTKRGGRAYVSLARGIDPVIVTQKISSRHGSFLHLSHHPSGEPVSNEFFPTFSEFLLHRPASDWDQHAQAFVDLLPSLPEMRLAAYFDVEARPRIPHAPRTPHVPSSEVVAARYGWGLSVLKHRLVDVWARRAVGKEFSGEGEQKNDGSKGRTRRGGQRRRGNGAKKAPKSAENDCGATTGPVEQHVTNKLAALTAHLQKEAQATAMASSKLTAKAWVAPWLRSNVLASIKLQPDDRFPRLIDFRCMTEDAEFLVDHERRRLPPDVLEVWQKTLGDWVNKRSQNQHQLMKHDPQRLMPVFVATACRSAETSRGRDEEQSAAHDLVAKLLGVEGAIMGKETTANFDRIVPLQVQEGVESRPSGNTRAETLRLWASTEWPQLKAVSSDEEEEEASAKHCSHTPQDQTEGRFLASLDSLDSQQWICLTPSGEAVLARMAALDRRTARGDGEGSGGDSEGVEVPFIPDVD